MILILSFALFLAGCGSEEPEAAAPSAPQCTDDSQCRASADGFMCGQKCVAGQCVADTLNCCGNNICDASENECTCTKDCTPLCEGDVEYTDDRGKKQIAQYFNKQCLNDECQRVYDEKDFDPRSQFNEMSKDNIVLGATFSYVDPFAKDREEILVELTLRDVSSDLVGYPIKIQEVRAMEGVLLLGRVKNVDKRFDEIGDTVEVAIPITYAMKYPEEEKVVTIDIDYKYDKLKKVPQQDGNGQTVKDQYGQTVYIYFNDSVKIGQMSQRITDKLYFVDPKFDYTLVNYSGTN